MAVTIKIISSRNAGLSFSVLLLCGEINDTEYKVPTTPDGYFGSDGHPKSNHYYYHHLLLLEKITVGLIEVSFSFWIFERSGRVIRKGNSIK